MAKDIIHDAVKSALIKDGWTITADPYYLKYEEFELFVDLAAERTPLTAEKNGQKIIVEIKTFAGRSFVKDLQQALGQYQIYLSLVQQIAPDHTLYLALSQKVYNDFFSQKATQFIVNHYKLKLLVVDVEQEEIVKWIN
jgi:hypothetical protein